MIIGLAAFVEQQLVIDGQMDRQTLVRQTHDDRIYHASIVSHGKKYTKHTITIVS